MSHPSAPISSGQVRSGLRSSSSRRARSGRHSASRVGRSSLSSSAPPPAPPSALAPSAHSRTSSRASPSAPHRNSVTCSNGSLVIGAIHRRSVFKKLSSFKRIRHISIMDLCHPYGMIINSMIYNIDILVLFYNLYKINDIPF